MIEDRKTLKMYLDADKFALGINRCFPIPYFDAVWIYERTLRFYEFHKNRKHFIRRCYYSLMLNVRGQRLGFSISGNCFGPGLRINHHGCLVVNANAKIGKWCDIHQGVNIGENGCFQDGSFITQVPVLGDFVFIGPGAKIFGGCVIGDNVQIGANAVVNKDVHANCVVCGIPQTAHDKVRKTSTIASGDFESLFLEKYPLYKTMIACE